MAQNIEYRVGHGGGRGGGGGGQWAPGMSPFGPPPATAAPAGYSAPPPASATGRMGVVAHGGRLGTSASPLQRQLSHH